MPNVVIETEHKYVKLVEVPGEGKKVMVFRVRRGRVHVEEVALIIQPPKLDEREWYRRAVEGLWSNE